MIIIPVTFVRIYFDIFNLSALPARVGIGFATRGAKSRRWWAVGIRRWAEPGKTHTHQNGSHYPSHVKNPKKHKKNPKHQKNNNKKSLPKWLTYNECCDLSQYHLQTTSTYKQTLAKNTSPTYKQRVA